MINRTVKHANEEKPIYSAQLKWGHAASGGELGFQPVPDILLRKQKVLGINNTELVVLLNITLHWWMHDKWPFPRPSNIASRMGVSTRTVERAIEGLEEKGILERLENVQDEKGHSVRYFDLTKLVIKLKLFAGEKVIAA